MLAPDDILADQGADFEIDFDGDEPRLKVVSQLKVPAKLARRKPVEKAICPRHAPRIPKPEHKVHGYSSRKKKQTILLPMPNRYQSAKTRIVVQYNPTYIWEHRVHELEDALDVG